MPVTTKRVAKSTHPWVNEHCRALVARKREAEGTEAYAEALRECSEGLLEAYKKWVAETRDKLRALPRGSKKWWKLARALAQKAEKNSSVPPLKRADKTWATDAGDKAELFLETFCEKYKLPQKEENEYTELGHPTLKRHYRFFGCADKTRRADFKSTEGRQSNWARQSFCKGVETLRSQSRTSGGKASKGYTRRR